MINKSFDIPQERIDEICDTNKKFALYINIIVDFSSWVSNNLADLEIETWYSIYDEFIQNNQDLIEKINKIINNNNKFKSSRVYILPLLLQKSCCCSPINQSNKPWPSTLPLLLFAPIYAGLWQ